jgi:hypothetical protein
MNITIQKKNELTTSSVVELAECFHFECSGWLEVLVVELWNEVVNIPHSSVGSTEESFVDDKLFWSSSAPEKGS